MKGLLLYLLFISSVVSFHVFPDWLSKPKHFQNALNKARIEIAWKISQGDKSINTDAMRLDEKQVEQILSELNAVNVSAEPSWYRTKFEKCMDTWALEELRCNVHFYDERIKKQCEDRLAEHTSRKDCRNLCEYLFIGMVPYCKKVCKEPEMPTRRCNAKSDFCMFHPCRGIYNEIIIK